MSLIIETGSGVANATAYGVTDETTTYAKVREYAADRVTPMTSDNAELTAYLILATQYIEERSGLFVGTRATTTQRLSWPRKCVWTDPYTLFPSDQLPESLLMALYQLCVEQENGIDLMPTVKPKPGFLIRRKLDVLETAYSEKIVPTNKPLMPIVEMYLSHLCWNAAAAPGFRVIRA